MATPGKCVLLDTSVVVHHFRDSKFLLPKIAEYQEFYLSHVVVAELYAGTFRSSHPKKHLQQITQFLDAVDVLYPDEATPEIYGCISARLAQLGTPIPQNDIWIAAIALQMNLPLATADKHFQRVDELTVLLW